MAQLAVRLGVGLLGSAVGLPFGVGWLVGGIISGLLFSKNQHGPRLKDFEISTSTYGRARPKCWGTNRLAPNIIDALPVVEHSHTDKGIGKGSIGGGMTTYTYTRTVALGCGYGVQAGITRIWADKKLILDLRPGSTVTKEKGLNYRFYPGSETQMPDPTLEAHYGVGNQSAYRGEAYIVLIDYPLTPHGNRLPNFEVEITQGLSASWPEANLAMPDSANFVYTFTQDIVNNVVYSISENTSTNDFYLTKYDAVSGDIIVSTPYDLISQTQGIVCTLDGSVYGVNAASFAHFDIVGFEPATLTANTLFTSGFGELAGTPLSVGESATFGWGPYIFIADTSSTGKAWLFQGGGGLLVEINHKVRGTDYTGAAMQMAAWSADKTMWVVGGGNLHKCHIGVSDWSIDSTIDLSSYATTFDRITYWAEENSLIISTSDSGTNVILQFSCDSETVVQTYSNSMSTTKNLSSFQSPIMVNGVLFYTDNNNFYLLDLVTGEETFYDKDNWGVSTTTDETIFEPVSQAFWKSGFSPERLFINRATPGATTVEAILEDVANICTLPSANYDFTNMPDEIFGMKMEEQATGKSVYEILTTGYFFDVVERDIQLRSVRRGGSSVVTVTEADLGAANEGFDFSVIHSQEKEIPREIALSFYDKDHDYLVHTEPAIRASAAVSSDEKREIRMPISMGVDQAITLVHRMLYVLWAGNKTLQWKSHWGFIRPDTADPLDVQVDGIDYQARITKTNLGADLAIEFQAITDERTIYDIALTGSSASGVPTQTVQYVPGTQVELLDTAMLRDADNNAGFYATGQPVTPTAAWKGWTEQVSLDAATFTPLFTATRKGRIGSAATVLPSTTRWTTWDDVSTVDIVMPSDTTLISTTDDGVLNGGNAFLIGNEIVQAVNITDLGGGKKRLSRLLRGRRGTEFYVSGHAIGDRVVVLTADILVDVAGNVADLGTLKYYRAFSIGQTGLFAPVSQFTNTGRRLKPYAPNDARASRDGSNNLTVTWLRRDRITPVSMWSPPMSESTLQFDVDFYNGSTIVRTKTVTAETVSYTAAEQTTDGLTPGNPVRMIIYQISATVNRGYGLDVML